MFEKVNPSHPDKIADRIAGAIVDLAYRKEDNPRIAVEVLVGHGQCFIVTESSVEIPDYAISSAVYRLAGGNTIVTHVARKQDAYLAANQNGKIRCGDNGIFRGVPVTYEQEVLSEIARDIYEDFPTDGKYILDGDRIIVCQSCAEKHEVLQSLPNGLMRTAVINPLGPWTGGLDVDTGATNRKLGSDMGDSVTGGGLHGKDLSKADVSVNIYAWVKAQQTGKPVELCCAIGDETVDGKPYSEIVEAARWFIRIRGGFERFAEWGLF